MTAVALAPPGGAAADEGHPLLTLYPGSKLSNRQEQQFDRDPIILGIERKGEFLSETLGGRVAYAAVTVGRDRHPIDIVELAAMETGLVKVTANAIAKGLRESGQVVLDGIFFDTDKATIKARCGALAPAATNDGEPGRAQPAGGPGEAVARGRGIAGGRPSG
jgi:hypothetical protein